MATMTNRRRDLRQLAAFLGAPVVVGLSVTGCARFAPSDPANPPLALVRIGDRLEIQLPACAAGSEGQRITVEDEATSGNPHPKMYWEVRRPWPQETAGRRIDVGRVTPGMQVLQPYAELPATGRVFVTVSSEDQTWQSTFALGDVSTTLNLGDNVDPAPGKSSADPAAMLDRQAGCAA
jgi:hypothetical protein